MKKKLIKPNIINEKSKPIIKQGRKTRILPELKSIKVDKSKLKHEKIKEEKIKKLISITNDYEFNVFDEHNNLIELKKKNNLFLMNLEIDITNNPNDDYEKLLSVLPDNLPIIKVWKYSDFINSRYWKIIRNKIISDNNHCIICGSKERLQLHHQTYTIHGNEHLKENWKHLITLCNDCHYRYHELQKESVNLEYLNRKIHDRECVCFKCKIEKGHLKIRLFDKRVLGHILDHFPSIEQYDEEHYRIPINLLSKTTIDSFSELTYKRILNNDWYNMF